MQNLYRRILFQYLYFRQPPWDTGISPPELLEFIQSHPAGRAIDLGCGTGTNIITLVQAGWQVTGIDFAPRAIKLARQKLKKAHIRANVLVKDVTRLQELNEQFDFAFDLGCFHGIAHAGKAKYLEGLDSILAPAGYWLMYGFLKSNTLDTGSGLSEADLGSIPSQFTLLSRRDGFDKREKRSAWFLFQKQEPV